MLMPIVSMNKMAMNESVAATCCYRQVPSATTIYWEVLNGGWRGAGYVETLGWKDAAADGTSKMKAWSVYPYDVKASGNAAYGAHYVTRTTDVNGSTIYLIDGAADIEGWFYNYGNAEGFSKGSSCTHSDGTCAYRVWDTAMVENYHWDSKTKHTTGGDNWAKPHAAKQFNS